MPEQYSWSSCWEVTSNEGLYIFGEKESDRRNAYLNGVHYGKGSDRLHMSWDWREKGIGRMVNVNYTYSDDNGRNWFNSAGQQIGSPQQLISVNSAGLDVQCLFQLKSISEFQSKSIPFKLNYISTEYLNHTETTANLDYFSDYLMLVGFPEYLTSKKMIY